MTTTILPANATPQERAIELATARMGEFDVPLRHLWDPTLCPAELLGVLAWALAVEEWDNAWPESVKRTSILESVNLHFKKGTVYAVKHALAVAGYANATLTERTIPWVLDGSVILNGSRMIEASEGWAEFRVFLSAPIANRQAEQVRRIVAAYQPARCSLVALNYTAAANILDGAWSLDGTYNLGVA